MCLTYTGIGKRMINYIAKHESNIWFGQSHDLIFIGMFTHVNT